MRSIIIAVVAICLVTQVFCAPADNEAKDTIQGSKQTRVTCDLFSIQIWGIAFNDSLCAAHCLILGRRGGSCQGGICVCRR